MQHIQGLTDNTQQNNLHSMEEHMLLFTDDTDTHCDYSISDHTSDTEKTNDTHTDYTPKYPIIHSQRKDAYVVPQQDHLLSCQLCPAFPPAWKEWGAIRLQVGIVC